MALWNDHENPLEGKPAARPTPQLVFGIVVILLGTLFTLDNLGILDAGEYLRLWPVLLVVFGLTKFTRQGDAPAHFIGAVFVALGGVILLKNLGVFHFSVWRLWPLLLVVLGISVIWQVLSPGGKPSGDSTSSISAMAVMGGVQRNCASQDFRGGDLTAVMGGCEIDLRDARMQADEAVIRTFAFWGGIEIKVPEEWTVIMEGFPFLGGFEERTHPPRDGPVKNLRIKGLAIMGGVEIRN